MPRVSLFSLDVTRGSELKLCSVWGPCSPSVHWGACEGCLYWSQERRVSEASAEYLPRAAPSLRVRFTQADKPVVRQLNRTDEEAVMRRIFVFALAALALLGVVTPDALAQAPTPTFKINGIIDSVTTYSRNASNYDGDLALNDTQWYMRSRGRFDFIGEVGKAKGVLGSRSMRPSARPGPGTTISRRRERRCASAAQAAMTSTPTCGPSSRSSGSTPSSRCP